MSGPGEMSDLLRLTELAEKLGALDSREGEHFRHVAGQLGSLAETVAAAGTQLDRHGEILSALDGLDEQVLALAGAVAALSEGDADDEEGGGEAKKGPYRPAAAARWWSLQGDEREQALADLRAWIRDIYVPGYGHLAAALPACWTEHDLILYGLDVVSQLWMTLYLTPRRSMASLAGQAEFQTRILPLYVSQMLAEANGCEHLRRRQP